ncbi:hypothetical protein GBAR_LOCUS16766 [Geodia barretti]|uniref:Uncharacterized protein n=1 Tax=Geodia barretti TaxID=519541 RepID=A0AA35WWT8_GEOBA|nr:hypothetical protein GBAR_LOCUS16766 [Geodia barretti]
MDLKDVVHTGAYKIRSFLLILQIILLQAMANVVTLSWARDGHLLSIAEMVILCALLALCLVVIIIGFTAVVFENLWLVPVWYFILSPYYAYFVYKIVHVAANYNDDYKPKVVVFDDDDDKKGITTGYGYIGSALITTCFLGLIVLALMSVFMAFSHRNFRKGLKEKAPPPTEQWQSLWRRMSTGFTKMPKN